MPPLALFQTRFRSGDVCVRSTYRVIFGLEDAILRRPVAEPLGGTVRAVVALVSARCRKTEAAVLIGRQVQGATPIDGITGASQATIPTTDTAKLRRAKKGRETTTAEIQATTAEDKVQAVLLRFGGALEQGDTAAAVACFEPDGYWRDLVSFTWNIVTQEGAVAIKAMLNAQLAHAKPSRFRIASGEIGEDGGGFEQAWVEFETATGGGTAISASATARYGHC